VNPNSESETIAVKLTQAAKAKIKEFDFDFGELAIKGRDSQGNILSKYPIQKITRKSVGSSTLGGRRLWFDDVTGRLNTDERGRYLGEFDTEDRILVVYKNGAYELTDFELTNRYEVDKLHAVTKLTPETVIAAVHYDGKQKDYFVKRFRVETTTVGKPFPFISEESGSKLIFASVEEESYVSFKADKKVDVTVCLNDIVDVKGWKAQGNRLDKRDVSLVRVASPEAAALARGVRQAALPKAEESANPASDSPKVHVGDTVEWGGDGTLFG
jgi:topoisomerase-4 subunit A